MDFCTNCGEKLTGIMAFCQSCGEKVESVNPTPATNSESNKQVSSPQHKSTEVVPTAIPRKPMSTRNKVVIVLVVAVITLVFGAKYIIDKMYDPYAQLKEMHQAFIGENRKEFYSHFKIPDYTYGGADEFYEWVDKVGWPSVRQDIEEQLERFIAGKSMDPVSIGYKDALRLREEKVLFGFGKKITFTYRPLELEIQSEFDGTIITVEETEIEVGILPDNSGKFIPGVYDTTYYLRGPYMDIKGETDMYVYPDNYDNYTNLYYEIEYSAAKLYSNRHSAIVYINGESTEKTFDELNVIYPISINSDSFVQLVDKDEDGNEIKSEKYELTPGETYIEFPYDQEQEIKNYLVNFYENYRDDFMYANNYANFSYISDYFEAGSQIYEDYKKFVEDQEIIDYYHYSFISNDVKKVEQVSDTEYMLYSTEEFDFSTADEITNYIREKSYKMKISDDVVIFTEINDLNTKKTVKGD